MKNEDPFSFNKKKKSKYFVEKTGHEIPRFASMEILKNTKLSSHSKSEEKAEVAKNLPADKIHISNKRFKESHSDVICRPVKLHETDVTPLLQQYTQIKNSNPSVLLFIECGYKYRFFEKDAEIASRVLNITTNIYHGVKTASIPTYRLHVHLKRLVKKGHKVGIVKQSEATADSLQSGSKSLPFVRSLIGIYSRSTLIGEDVSPLQDDAMQISGPLMTISEESTNNSSRKIAIVIINVALGQIFINEANELESLVSRLESFQPVEFLISEDISTEINMLVKSYMSCQSDAIRLERYNSKQINYSLALCELTSIIKDDMIINQLSSLSKLSVCCLFAAYQFLKEFGLQSTLSILQPYNEDLHTIRLPAMTLRNLEMTKNNEDHSIKYSLYWVLNKTETKFGARMLYNWILNPLVDIEQIKERQDVIDELMYSDSHIIHTVKILIQKLPDLESSLVAIFHKKCSPFKFYTTVKGLNGVYSVLQSLFWRDECLEVIKSNKLREILWNVREKLTNIGSVFNQINADPARQNKKSEILRDWSNFPEVLKIRQGMQTVLQELENLLPILAKKLNLKNISYSTFYGEDFLIEVPLPQCSFVPYDWQLISSSKNIKRYRSPQVQMLCKDLQQVKKDLEVQCNKSWLLFMEQFLVHYYEYKSAVKSLAMLDAFISLAKVSSLNGYVKPTFNTNNKGIVIEEGKHPIVSVIKTGDEPFIANGTCLKKNYGRVIILTGPNMGGKSCYMKQVALICIMGQIGCFVPAKSAELPVLDGIYVRMGASDEIGLGRSTFMIEASETADITNWATENSLVILDEFGRGTSSCDGISLASAVLQHFIEVRSFTIFVTHYTSLCDFEVTCPGVVVNYHMSYFVHADDEDPAESVTFLYQLAQGRAESSYGLNVARLSGIPFHIVARAAVKAHQQEGIIFKKNILRKAFVDIFTSTDNLRSKIEQLAKL